MHASRSRGRSLIFSLVAHKEIAPAHETTPSPGMARGSGDARNDILNPTGVLFAASHPDPSNTCPLSTPLPDFLRHSKNQFQCLVCPLRKGRPLTMTASHAREHLSSGVHRRYSKIASHGPLCSSSAAGPVPYIDTDDVQQSTSAEPVRVALLCCIYYLTSFQMTVEDAVSESTGGRLHFTPYTYVPPSSITDINQPSSHDTSPVTDPLRATGCGQADSSLYNSRISFDHADNVRDVDHQWSTQPTWPEQPDVATFDFPLGEDNDPLPDDENICGEVDVSDLNVDLNGEFVILSSFSHCQTFLAVAEFEDIPSTPLGVSPTSPTFPYPSFAVSLISLFLCTSTHTPKLYLTDMLFSSPRLRFSEQQKKAVLNWATQLGARNVPSLYSLSQCRENIKKVVGDSVMAVTTGTGHKLYMQDIPFLVAKVRLSPHGCNHYL